MATSPGKITSSLVRHYVRTFFTVLAAAIGTGIFALPVEIWRCGVGPFLLTYGVAFVAQAVFVWVVVEVFQRTQIKLDDEARTTQQEQSVDSETGASKGKRLDESSDAEEQGDESSPLVRDGRQVACAPVEDVNLFTVSRVCLPKILHYGWLATIMLHHTGILVSYALAGSMSYGKVFGWTTEDVVVPFIFSCLLVVFLNAFFKDIISLLTIVKAASLVILCVGVASIASTQKDQDFTDNWVYVLHPFVMSNVAIGGIIWIIPVMYAGLPVQGNSIRAFRAVNVGAIGAGAALVVAWGLMVLFIVPQTGPAPTLEDAKRNGHIATLPVVEVLLGRESKGLQWAGKAAHGLVVVSVTISFILFAMSLKNLTDGAIMSVALSCVKSTGSRMFKTKVGLCQTLALIILFGFVAVFVQFNPKSFFHVLKIAVSIALCMGNILVIIMYRRSLQLKLSRQPVLPLSPQYRIVSLVILVYYTFLIVFTVSAEVLSVTKVPWAKYILS